ncbi:MAG: M4 family metallopeptidase [Candidatus Zixiibacteriota bacterium]
MMNPRFNLVALLVFCLVFGFSTAWTASNQAYRVTGGPVEKMTISPDFGTVETVSGRFTVADGASFADKARSFVASRQTDFKIQQPAQELELISEKTDNLGLTHVRFQQVYQGVPVWGCQTIVHFENDRTIYIIGGQTIPTPQMSVAASIDDASAEQLAIDALKDQLTEKNLATSAETVIYPNAGNPRLAQLVTITSPVNGAIRWRVFVDAQTGDILNEFNDIQFDGPDIGSGLDTRDSVRPLNIYDLSGTYYLIDATHSAWIYTYNNYYNGGPLSTDLDGDKIWDDVVGQKAEVAAHYYVMKSYEYFLNTFGRDSYDGAGTDIIANAHDPVYVNNAYWNGQAVNFADGDGVNYLPFSGSLDVVAHELAHGVTQYTAGLIYQYQSGAINESFSDVFGAMVDRDDWYLGEEIGLVGNYIRSMEDPNLKGHPKHMSDYRNISTDNGGVHINSGIPNHAYYHAATWIGKDKAEQIWYRALSTYLTPSSGFYFFAGMVIQSTIDLYGYPSPELDSVEAALADVGLGTSYAKPDWVQAGALIGESSSNDIWIFNPGTSAGSQTVTVIPPSITGLTVGPGPYYQEAIPDGDSSQFVITYDATTFDECGVGSFFDTLRFEVTGAYGTTYIKLPMTVTVGLTTRDLQGLYFSTSCLTARTYNTSALDELSRGGIDVLYDASLVVGMIDGASYKVYRDFFETQSLIPVDIISVSPGSETFRIASKDGRIQGRVTYTYDIGDAGNCDFIIADYSLFNICDTALNIFTGLVADLDVDYSGSNQANFDDPRDMVYVMNDGDTRAAGTVLLSGSSRNLRALYNPSLIYNGAFTDAVAYNEMFATNNLSGLFAGDWSTLLTFGNTQIGSGDTVQYQVAFVYSNTGSSGLGDIADRAAAFAASLGFVCGDVNGNETVNILDVTALITYLYKGGPAPDPLDAADVNSSGNVNLLDVTFLISYLYKGGPAPNCP